MLRLSTRRPLSRDRTHVVAIVNVTPDSFSGDGMLDVDAAVAYAEMAVAAGAEVLDIGAESTRPGATSVSLEEELMRLLPTVTALRSRMPEIVLSIDTYKPEVFRAAAACGGDTLNLVRPLEDAHLDVVVETGSSIIITQAGIEPSGPHESINQVISSLLTAADRVRARGLSADRIVLDPGFGFGKTPEQNIALLGHLHRFSTLGYGTMLAASRKSTLGILTGRAVDERGHATSATTALAALAGIDFVRVHDVDAALDVIRVCNAASKSRTAA